ncbi:YraN family protein [Roseovarius sp. LXJ103]|uniref:YraN family protein n=1 Tax=Roseovarius carneus TaxID=2853164 RepID=UPI000D606A27|nr:YraN family protein [Roseovarius carneus]MBZ8118222.1 YraN family protein [Roseovarius carneus]PWE36054.1 PII uridylyl-transferase [Pelagicola sp. LXJ1103]
MKHSDVDDCDARPVHARQRAGRQAYLSGHAAEARAIDLYVARGAVLLETRWRGQSGEIDLIFEQDGEIIFAEVKSARTHEAAIARLGRAQMQRIHRAGSEYLAHTPKGQLSDVRFDLVVVDGQGCGDILEGVFSHF